VNCVICPVAARYGRRYTLPREPFHKKDAQDPSSRSSSVSGESIAFMMLAGIALGVALGAGIDWLVRTSPLFLVIGVFAGLGIALYAVYIETK